MQGDRVSPQNGCASGEVRVYRVDEIPGQSGVKRNLTPGVPVNWRPVSRDPQPNTIMYDWATIVAKLLQNAGNLDGKSYHVQGLYVEFENNGGDAVSAPSYDRSGGLSYYASLALSATRDYLRVPLTAATVSSTDETDYPGGNKITFFAQTQGVVGVHGKAFNDSVQSRVYGGALVAFPDSTDATQDLIFSRFYFADTANQLVKLAGSQIGLEWPITFV
jgi:hypothetical protein